MYQLHHQAGLQLKIGAEDKIAENKINSIHQEWEKAPPVHGRSCRHSYERHHCLWREAFEELRDLKVVWTALLGIWCQIGELKEPSWVTRGNEDNELTNFWHLPRNAYEDGASLRPSNLCKTCCEVCSIHQSALVSSSRSVTADIFLRKDDSWPCQRFRFEEMWRRRKAFWPAPSPKCFYTSSEDTRGVASNKSRRPELSQSSEQMPSH